MKSLPFLCALFCLLLALTACGGASGEMDVADVWGRSSPAAAANGAFYMQITNRTGRDDALLAVRSDACGAVELHEMAMLENDVMSMRPVPESGVPLPDGEMVSLQVGGLHVMCIDKVRPFVAGDTVQLTLEFAQAAPLDVTADIRDAADMPGMDMDGG